MNISYKLEDGNPIAIFNNTRRGNQVDVYSQNGTSGKASIKYVDRLPDASIDQAFHLKEILRKKYIT